ncbi:hypothetical protein [Croceimicrobium sp.]|uniref:hypothetical protein n=1 Tax=Croceimicrobium sp. TaxID=2828340 RepID=UPI003BAC1B2D
MSKPTFTDNTYAGNVDPEIYLPLLLPKGGIADRGLVTVKYGIKKREVIRDLDVNIKFQNRSAKFVDDALNVEFAETYLDPVGYEVMKEIDFLDLVKSWDAAQIKPGAAEDYVPPANLNEVLLNRMAERIGNANEELYINGKAGVTQAVVAFDADYNGIVYKMENSADTRKASLNSLAGVAVAGISTADDEVTTSTAHGFNTGDMVTLVGLDGNQQYNGVSLNGQSFVVIKTADTKFKLETEEGVSVDITGVTAATTGTAVSINETNVVQVLSHIYRRTPRAVRNQSDFKLIVPDHVADSYKLALAMKADGAGMFTVGDRELDFLSFGLEKLPYFPANSIAAWNAGNVFLGLDGTDDAEKIRMKHLGEATIDDVVRYKASMKSDINAKFFNEIYWARPV